MIGVRITLEAEISVRSKRLSGLIKATGRTSTSPTGQNHETFRTRLTLRSTTFRRIPYYAEYPNGDSGVSIFQSRPWQGTPLTEGGDARVRGVWRFYTARNTNWDTLVRSNRTDSATVESDAIPVYVHAYPSRIGPRAEPVRDGPEIIDTWGTDRPSPDGTLGENINIDIVNQSYTTTYGVAVRAESVDRDALK